MYVHPKLLDKNSRIVSGNLGIKVHCIGEIIFPYERLLGL